MKTKLLASTISALILLSGCSETATQSSNKSQAMQAQTTSLFYTPSPLEYQAPEFDKIKMSDYKPAFVEGMKQHSAEIDAIANNPEPATFDNTIVALEKSGELLNRVSTNFFNLSGMVSNDEYLALESEMSPKLTEHSDNIYLNGKLFSRVAAIYAKRDQFKGEDKRLIDVYYKDFVRAGANLSEENKSKMREINSELSKLTTEFSQNILASFKNDVIVVTDPTELDGLPEDEINSLAAAAKKADKKGYLISLVNTTRQPILKRLKNRQLREKIWKTSAFRGQNVNAPIVLKVTSLRAQKAKLLGFRNWAAYGIDNQMAGKPSEVFNILDDLAPKARARAEAEAADIQAVMNREGKGEKLEPWDWAYYAEIVRKEKYSIDESQIKPYFEFNRVLEDGLFYTMGKLYGITFTPRKDLPTWNPDVLAFEIFNEDDSSVGLFYLDPYARQGKQGGAWMSEFVGQSFLNGTKPVVYNVLNIPKPAEGQPTLMTFDEVSTMFHEFGHGVHGLFSAVKYPRLAGTSVARDFVEFPSQFHEDYCIDPQVLNNYAKHYKTGERIPDALLTKMLKANKFNTGFNSTEYLAAALLDMEWHSISADEKIADINTFEKQALTKHGLDYSPVPPRYKSAYFSHSMGGYSAGYYAYLWTEVLAADAFAYLKTQGGITRKNGDLYRKLVLSKGNSRDLMQNYIELRGQKPTVDALLVRRGLVN